MNRRDLLKKLALSTHLAPTVFGSLFASAPGYGSSPTRSRVRPGDTAWPSEASWQKLSQDMEGRLSKVRPSLAACAEPDITECTALWNSLKNPYFLGDDVSLTQSLGWIDAWTSQPSAYAVSAKSTADVVAAVNFARENSLRLVVKGGGHSYQGTSNAPDSLLIWTRSLNAITLHDAFVGEGCTNAYEPQPAVTLQAGAMWGKVYDLVTTKAGRYVQGGGCLTVGVAGLVQSGGFGSFSKAYGTAAASLLEAEIVTADGSVRIANACTNADLFWAIKGGGGGSLGVVTRLTVRTHVLPEFFGAVFATIKATSADAFGRLIDKFLQFYGDNLLNPHWGEQIAFRPGHLLDIAMLFQGLDQEAGEAIWRPFFGWISASPMDFSVQAAPLIVALPAQNFWDPAFLQTLPGIVLVDDRVSASPDNIFWASNLEEAGQVLHAYQSRWIPASLLQDAERARLGDALFEAAQHWSVALHVNKGMAGAPQEAIAAVRDTATNPAVLDAFALIISAAEGPPAYPGVPGREPDRTTARSNATAVDLAMNKVRQVLPGAGSYVAESDFFEPEWQTSFWGENYARLLAVKARYDPDGLFFVHHGVGSERWSADGFTRLP